MTRAASGWRLATIGGTLWGVVVMLAEMPTLPIYDFGAAELATFGFGAFLPWVAAGQTWAAGAKIAEERGRWMLVLLLPVATAASLLTKAALELLDPQFNNGTGQILRNIPMGDIAPYFIWVNLFYGYLYAAGYLVARWRLRSRALLAVERRERSEADSALREARLAALRGQLQPDLLIEALRALQARFARADATGGALFDLLVAFLRAAMPGVRNQSSVLEAELLTVQHYSTLREALGYPALRLTPVATGAGAIEFPPLLLLPIVDILARQNGSDRTPEIRTHMADGTYTVAISAAGSGVLALPTLDLLRARVAQANGRVAVALNDATIGIVISLPLQQPARSAELIVAG